MAEEGFETGRSQRISEGDGQKQLEQCMRTAKNYHTRAPVVVSESEVTDGFVKELTLLGLRLHKSWFNKGYVTYENNADCMNAYITKKSTLVSDATGVGPLSRCDRVVKTLQETEVSKRVCYTGDGSSQVITSLQAELIYKLRHGYNTKLQFSSKWIDIGVEEPNHHTYYFVRITHVMSDGEWIKLDVDSSIYMDWVLPVIGK